MPGLACDSDFDSEVEDENCSISFPATKQYSYVFEILLVLKHSHNPREVQGAIFLEKQSSNVEKTTVLDKLTPSKNDIFGVQPKSSTTILRKEVKCVTVNNPSEDKNFRCCDCQSLVKYIKTCSIRCSYEPSGNKCLFCFPLSKGRCTNAYLDSFLQ